MRFQKRLDDAQNIMEKIDNTGQNIIKSGFFDDMKGINIDFETQKYEPFCIRNCIITRF